MHACIGCLQRISPIFLCFTLAVHLARTEFLYFWKASAFVMLDLDAQRVPRPLEGCPCVRIVFIRCILWGALRLLMTGIPIVLGKRPSTSEKKTTYMLLLPSL